MASFVVIIYFKHVPCLVCLGADMIFVTKFLLNAQSGCQMLPKCGTEV